jgi:hypothetical protein
MTLAAAFGVGIRSGMLEQVSAAICPFIFFSLYVQSFHLLSWFYKSVTVVINSHTEKLLGVILMYHVGLVVPSYI